MMFTRRLLQGSLFTVLASLAIYQVGCSSDDDVGSTEPANAEDDDPRLAGVIYEDETNDEGLALLLDADLVDDASRAPTISAPDEDVEISGPTTIEFEASGVSGQFAPSFEPSGGRELLRPLRGLWGPERSAHAHGAAMNGAAFFLAFEDDAGQRLLGVFTQKSSFTLTTSDVRALAEAGEVTLTIRLGFFEEGRLSRDGGPYASAPFHFTAAP